MPARKLPGLDVSLRGAVSIARPLQDPLAELVKIEPKAIGVGQYQHDLAEGKLSRSLDAVVEDCVNGVGVDVNTASGPLLARVSGLSERVAQNIVSHRDSNGPFRSRSGLKKGRGAGPQGVRIIGGLPADPERRRSARCVRRPPGGLSVVRRILQATKSDIKAVIGNGAVLKGLNPKIFTDETFGLPTVTDIIAEREKPGRDPRPTFKTATFQEGVEKIGDLKPGMVLEGVVTNVAAFGAFVDVGVHQDGLVHISALSKTFVKDPRAVVKPGDVVRAKVLEVDVPRKRISLTLRLDDEVGARPPREQGGQNRDAPRRDAPRPQARREEPAGGGALADALRKAGWIAGRGADGGSLNQGRRSLP